MWEPHLKGTLENQVYLEKTNLHSEGVWNISKKRIDKMIDEVYTPEVKIQASYNIFK